MPKASSIFSAEARGLREIKESGTVAVPEVITVGEFEQLGYLLLEFIEHKQASVKDYENLGRGLALMHRSTSGNFGFSSDNFIGLLSQENQLMDSWPIFYVSKRLLPQLKKAFDSGHLSTAEVPAETKMLEACQNLFPEVSPALLHGDLWSGNYLISKSGTPYVIDPAVYYGHREADLAMSRLFGGFDEPFYLAYYELWPKEPGEEERTEIYQLYHLLVHLNLFGLGYKASVKRTLEKYFK